MPCGTEDADPVIAERFGGTAPFPVLTFRPEQISSGSPHGAGRISARPTLRTKQGYAAEDFLKC